MVKRILVVRNDRFGEFLLNIPALRALKETFSAARIVAVVDPYVAELARCVPFVDEIIAWGGRKRSLVDILRMSAQVRKRKFDTAVMLNPSRDFNIITALAGVPVRVGYNRKMGYLLTHKMVDTKHRGIKHEVEYNLDLVRLIGASTDNLRLSLSVESGIINTFLEQFGIEAQDRLVVLHPWTSDPVKNWPYFGELAVALSKEAGIRLVIVGRDEGRAAGFGNLSGNSINLANRTSLVQLAAVLSRCSFLVSCDSGPVHLSCCVGTPVVALFSSASAAKSAKRWGPWGENSTVIEKPSLSHISVSEVLDAVRKKLRPLDSARGHSERAKRVEE